MTKQHGEPKTTAHYRPSGLASLGTALRALVNSFPVDPESATPLPNKKPLRLPVICRNEPTNCRRRRNVVSRRSWTG